MELYKGLAERKKKLESVLQGRIKDLKDLCLQESEITGELPHEYKLFMSPGERTPPVKRRVGTGFSIAGNYSLFMVVDISCVITAISSHYCKTNCPMMLHCFFFISSDASHGFHLYLNREKWCLRNHSA